MLDNGAQGIIVPRVNTADQVRDIVSWTRYPPHGIRGFACTPAQTDGVSIPPGEFMDRVHENTLLVIQIERQEAVGNLEAMLSIPGVNVACLGYMDLSVNLGIPGQTEHPRMVAAIQRMVDVAQRNQVASGIIAPDLATISRWVERGIRFVSYSSDALLLRDAATTAVSRLQSLRRQGGH